MSLEHSSKCRRKVSTAFFLAGAIVSFLVLLSFLILVFDSPGTLAAVQGGTVARCGTRVPSATERQTVAQALAFTPSALRAPGSIQIGIVFHVIASPSGRGAVDDGRLDSQINALNRAFSGQGRPAVGQQPAEVATANTSFRFFKKEVRRYYNDEWFFGLFDPASDTQRLGGPETLNVYVYNLYEGSGLLGFASFPSDYNNAPVDDGVHIDVRTVPGGGGSLQQFHGGDTLVHEIGHWLGLYHTFNDSFGCVPNYDGVDDTAAEWGPYLGTPPPYKDSCTGSGYRGRDPLENFMDYTDDVAMFQFTQGQSNRMEKMARRYRGL